jgi:hypothetical protein
MRKVALAFVILALPGLAAGQSRKKGTPAAKKPVAAPSPQVAVAGLRVVGPGLGSEQDLQRPFNWSKGVTVVLGVRVAAPYALVEIEKDQSTLELTDSQGGVLESPEVDWSPDFTKDGTAVLVDLEAKSLPAEGSAHIAAKGSLMFKVSSGTKTVKVTGVKLEKGTPVKLGASAITITEVEDQEGGEGPRVTFKSTRSVMKGIKTLRAKDGKGAPVEVSWSHSGGWDEEYEMGYRFKMAAKVPVTLEFDMYDGLRQLAVPFDVKAGVGVPAQ